MTAPTVLELDVPMTVGLKKSVRPLTHNDRIHWRARSVMVKTIRHGVAWAAKAHRVPAATHLTVQLHYRPGGRSVTDAPNLTATSKPAIDGLVDAGWVPDDKDRYVTELMPLIHREPGFRRCWLTVEVTP